MKTWPSWLLGSTVGADPADDALDVAGADDVDRGRLLGRELGKILGRHQADQIVFAARDDVEQRLAAPRGHSPHDRRRGRDHARDRRLDVDRAAFGQVEPGQRLAGGDGVAGIGQHVGDLQPLPLRPHRALLARNHDAGNLDDIGKAGLRRLEHGDRGALGGVGVVGGAGRVGERGGGRRGRASLRESARETRWFIGGPVQFRKLWISEGRSSRQPAMEIGYSDISLMVPERLRPERSASLDHG